MNLYFGERLRKYRRERELTQEELAQAIGVSYQSVSKWERADGYPDITLLPAIANYFGVTIDTLLGNDETAREEDVERFYELIHGNIDDGERIRVAIEYARKYPKNYSILHSTADILMELPEKEREPHLPLIKELCSRIIDECTAPALREDAVRFMSCICTDEEFFEKWALMCSAGYESCRGEVLEERLWQQGKHDASRERFDVNNFRILCHFLFRQNRNRTSPARAAAWSEFRLRFLEFLAGERVTQSAWLGPYAHYCFYIAHSCFGCGRIHDGYAYLEKAVNLFSAWCAIPDETLLDAGCPELFGNLKVVKNAWQIELPDGSREYCLEMLHFSSDPAYLHCALNNTRGWAYFDAVREDDRFKAVAAQAQAMASADSQTSDE